MVSIVVLLMGFWKVVMEGPPASPYAEGVFMLYLEIGEDFPFKPPSVRFITPILHPNITKVRQILHTVNPSTTNL